nr:predicted GPI-anchored protein 58 [Aegilops tauschii subsp. strangulata]
MPLAASTSSSPVATPSVAARSTISSAPHPHRPASFFVVVFDHHPEHRCPNPYRPREHAPLPPLPPSPRRAPTRAPTTGHRTHVHAHLTAPSSPRIASVPLQPCCSAAAALLRQSRPPASRLGPPPACAAVASTAATRTAARTSRLPAEPPLPPPVAATPPFLRPAAGRLHAAMAPPLHAAALLWPLVPRSSPRPALLPPSPAIKASGALALASRGLGCEHPHLYARSPEPAMAPWPNDKWGPAPEDV